MYRRLKANTYEFFDRDSCDLCGICLNKCPVIQLPLQEAKKEIKRLIDGDRTKYVLQKCTSCMACDNFCERDCHPYELILQRWKERYTQKGMPAILESILPYSSPNIYEKIRTLLPQDERERASAWERAVDNPDSMKGSEDILFLGCNQFLNPYVTFTKLLEALPALGSPRLCCGEPLYRLGILDQVSRIAEELTQYFRGFTNRRLIMFCPAGYNMFTNVLPRKFGASFPFEIRFLGDWLWERIQQGKIQRRNPVRMRVTVQDSCHSKQLGKDFRALNRKIIEWTGAEVVEMPHHGSQALCCGLGAAGGWYPNVVPTLFRALREGGRAKAQAVVAYCNGCYSTLNIGRRFLPGPPIYHLLELVQLATGEEPVRRQHARSWQILRAGLGLLGSQGLSILWERRHLR